MLFDLRSRGRRRTVQVVYLGLAVLMGGGLVLFGVGTGNGVGGLLNAFSGNGSGNAQSAGGQPAGEDRAQGRPSQPQRPRRLGRLSRPAGRRRPAPTTTTADRRLHRRRQAGADARPPQAWQQLPEADQEARSRPRRSSPPAPTRQLGNYAGEANAWEIQTPRPARTRPRATSAWPRPPTPPSRPARAISPLAKALSLVTQGQPQARSSRQIQPPRRTPIDRSAAAEPAPPAPAPG